VKNYTLEEFYYIKISLHEKLLFQKEISKETIKNISLIIAIILLMILVSLYFNPAVLLP
jgi:hypothetical protein